MLQKMAVMALALGTALTLTAQQGPQGQQGPGGPEPGFGFGPRMGFFPGLRPMGFGGPGGQVVTNHPYTDTESTTDTMTRKDGKSVTHQVTEQKWRDATGRTRAEFTLPAVGNRPAVHRAEIFDPVANTVTSLDFNKNVAVVRQLPPPRQHRQRPQGEQGQQRPTPPGVTVSETDLPVKQIAGVYATGKQTTRTIAAGTHGNTEPIVQTSQRYISPDLKIVLSSQENGPRNSMVHQVTALTQVDPDESLFAVPQGFTVKNAPQHAFRGPRGPRGFRGPGSADTPPPAPGE